MNQTADFLQRHPEEAGADGKIKVCIGGGKVENDILRFCFLTKCFSRVFSKYSHFYYMQLMLPDISISSLIFSNHILISFIECLILFSIYTGAGFIGSHIAKKLKEEGCYVICADWNDNEFMANDDFCHEFHKVDLRLLENCLKVTEGCQHVYNLAADMGGMGFIVSNQSVLLYNNTMISFNMLEASRQRSCKRYFYSSTACVYNEALQTDPANPGLREDMAWPARPQDTYGLEKLYAEEMAIAYMKDFPIHCRVARYHNVYGPNGTFV